MLTCPMHLPPRFEESSTIFVSPAKGLRFLFGAAHLSKSLVWSFVDLLFAYFVHDVVRLPAERTGQLIFVLVLFGALCDVGVGASLAYFRATLRTVLLIHLLGAVATALLLFVQFDIGQATSTWILISGLLFRMAFSLYDVPQTALTSLLPANDAEARRYVHLRNVLSAIGRLAVTAAILGLTQLPALIFRDGVTGVLLLFSAVVIFTAAWLFYSSRTLIDRAARVRPQARRFAIPRELALLLLTFGMTVSLLATLNRLVIFTPHDGPWLLFVFSIGSVAGPALAMPFKNRVGWRVACAVSVMLAVLAGDTLAFAPGTAAALIYGIGLGAIGAYLWESAARLVAHHAAETGERIDAMVFGLIIFSIKISVALGSLILGSLIEGFQSGAPVSSAAIIVLTSISGICVAALLLNQRRVAVMA